MKKRRLSIISILVIFTLICMINASEYTLGTTERDECIELLQVVTNATNLTITKVIYPNKTEAFINQLMTQTTSIDYNFTFCNTSSTGLYYVHGYGYPDGVEDPFVYTFKVTPNGEEPDAGLALLYLGLIAVLVIFLLLSMYSFLKFDNLINRVGMIGAGYLMLMAISFIGWNMAEDFITSAPFISDTLRIIFYVLIIGFFPLVIGGFAWYTIMVLRIKQIEDLMERGLPYDEAEARVSKKRRW